jgi:hypothetical protein
MALSFFRADISRANWISGSVASSQRSEKNTQLAVGVHPVMQYPIDEPGGIRRDDRRAGSGDIAGVGPRLWVRPSFAFSLKIEDAQKTVPFLRRRGASERVQFSAHGISNTTGVDRQKSS